MEASECGIAFGTGADGAGRPHTPPDVSVASHVLTGSSILYLSVPDWQRTILLDETIAELQQWEDLAALRPEVGAVPPNESALLEVFAWQMTVWKKNATPVRRREMSEFDTALRTRWILRSLSLTPGQGT